MSRYLGKIYELLGAAITTVYQAGGAKGSGNGPAVKRHLAVLATLVGGSAITGVTIKAQWSVDGVSFFDLTSVNDVTGAAAIDQTFSTIVANTIQGQISVPDIWPWIRVQVKATGGAGAVGESIQVLANDAAA